jgi:hypothetical protein
MAAIPVMAIMPVMAVKSARRQGCRAVPTMRRLRRHTNAAAPG